TRGVAVLDEPAPASGSVPFEGTVRAPRVAPALSVGTLALESMEDSALRFVVAEGQTVGRTEKSDVVVGEVTNGKYISSAMARFTRRGDQWYVQHIATTNYIVVDGEEYEDDTEVAIHDGSVLALALAPFIVRIGGEA
ncbi:FHA domain-containing protein, partial [bacterium]